MWQGKSKPAVTALVGVLTLSACGGEDNSAPSAKYDGKEVKEIGCDKGAFDAVTARRVKSGGLSGFLSTRKSRDCSQIYWAKFTPDDSNKASFIVTVTKAIIPSKQVEAI